MVLDEIIYSSHPYIFLWLKNVVIPNYNGFKLLTFTKKNRRVSEHVLNLLIHIILTMHYSY